MRVFKLFVSLVVSCLLFSINCYSQENAVDLAKAAQNPLANMLSLPFQDNISFGMGPHDRTKNTLNFQPVFPFFNGRLITRTVLPFVSQPDLSSESGSTNGFDDITFTALYAPATKGGLIWGVGSAINVPVGKAGLAVREWGFGPSLVVVVLKGKWVFGGIINNVWSVDENSSMNLLTFQYSINYNFPSGLYIATSPAITANWKASSGNQWTVPFGASIGKVVKFGGKLPVNLQGGAYYNVVRPESGSDWSLRLQAIILLPKSMFK